MCDSVNHSRFPKEDHLPDWVSRDKHGNKGDRVEDVTFSFMSETHEYKIKRERYMVKIFKFKFFSVKTLCTTDRHMCCLTYYIMGG
jgi:hypothetical protein